MIDVVKNTPSEYSKQSRDFQVIARLYTAMFNYTKMYIDNMSVWNTNIDDNLASLRATTLNLITEHQWDLSDLEAITSCFKYLIIRKGTIEAIKALICILMKVQHLEGTVDDTTVTFENNNLTIRIEDALVTVGIIEDLFKYLLPAGLTYRIVRYKSVNINDLLNTNIYYNDEKVKYSDLSRGDYLYVGNNNSSDRIITRTYVYNNRWDPSLKEE